MVFFWKSQTFGKSLENFFLFFFHEIFKIHRLVLIFLWIFVVLNVLINVLFKVISTYLNFYKHCFIKDDLQKLLYHRMESCAPKKSIG
jgi:hypothetical protein